MRVRTSFALEVTCLKIDIIVIYLKIKYNFS